VPILPFAFATVTALVLAPALRASLAENGFVRENYRGAQLPFPFGVAVFASATVALVPLALVYAATDNPLVDDTPAAVMTFVLGVAALGLADDALSGPSRGWRGHGAAVMQGSFSTGALKAAGTLGLALWVTSGASTILRLPDSSSINCQIASSICKNRGSRFSASVRGRVNGISKTSFTRPGRAHITATRSAR